MIHPNAAHPDGRSLLKHALKQRLAIAIDVRNSREVDGNVLRAGNHALPDTLGFRDASPA